MTWLRRRLTVLELLRWELSEHSLWHLGLAREAARLLQGRKGLGHCRGRAGLGAEKCHDGVH